MAMGFGNGQMSTLHQASLKHGGANLFSVLQYAVKIEKKPGTPTIRQEAKVQQKMKHICPRLCLSLASGTHKDGRFFIVMHVSWAANKAALCTCNICSVPSLLALLAAAFSAAGHEPGGGTLEGSRR
jgi:hypothetical protein